MKALWNATQYRCAWFAIGADGLRTHRLGHQERHCRVRRVVQPLRGQYNQATPEEDVEARSYLYKDCLQIVKLNAGPHVDAAKLIRASQANPRMVYDNMQQAV